MSGTARILISIGLVFVVLGLFWPIIMKSGIGRLPGDLFVERGNFRFYFPITTLVLLNVVIWIVMRLFGGK